MSSSESERRLAALARYEILDSFPENRFERLTRLACDIFRVPISLISLLERDRQWFKSHRGLDTCETPLRVSFCKYAIEGDGVMVIPDATKDERFTTNPLVTGEPGIRFYAGAPLYNPEGVKIGTLCIIDTLPRRPLQLTEKQILTDLAAIVIDEMELRKHLNDAVRQDRRIEADTAAEQPIRNGQVDDSVVLKEHL